MMVRQILVALTLWFAVPFVGGVLGYILGSALHLL